MIRQATIYLPGADYAEEFVVGVNKVKQILSNNHGGVEIIFEGGYSSAFQNMAMRLDYENKKQMSDNLIPQMPAFKKPNL